MSEVVNLFTKPEKRAPMSSHDSITLITNQGIVDDNNRNSISPRQVLLVDLSSLEKFGLEAGQFRENITTKDFDLNTLMSGEVIQVGQEVQLRVTFTCEVCSYISSLKLNHSNKDVFGERGMLTTVLKGGTIRVGDEIIVINNVSFTEVPYKFSERLRWVVRQIPSGMIIDYQTLLKTVGGSNAYLRTFPKVLKTNDLPSHRVVDSKGKILSFIPNQVELLKQEGIEFEGDDIKHIDSKIWNTQGLYLMEA